MEINVEIKKYFCKAGVKGVQVQWEVFFFCFVLQKLKIIIRFKSQFSAVFSLVAPWKAACDLGAPDWRRASGRSYYDVLYSQACECFSPFALLSCLSKTFLKTTVLVCLLFVEARHQLDRTYKSVGYPRSQVSF